MDVSAFFSEASFWTPEHALEPFAPSVLHPAVFWIVEAAQPMSVARLGFQRPDLYFAVCEAVKRLGLATSCVAVAPTTPSSPGETCFDAPFQRASEAHALAFEGFSRIARVPVEEMIEIFPDRSIDLIHIAEPDCARVFRRDLDAWRSKLSERAILLLSQTNEPGTRGFLQELARDHPSFEFTHGDGLGVIALGPAPPERVRALLDADAVPILRDQIRQAYSRLGESLDIGTSAGPALVEKRGAREALREENQRITAKMEDLGQALETLGQANEALRRENSVLRHDLEHYQHLHALANEQLDALRQSAAVVLVEKTRRVRSRYFPQTRLHGRCLELAVRFARVSVQTGPRAAVGQAARRLLRKVGVSSHPAVPPSAPEPTPAPDRAPEPAPSPTPAPESAPSPAPTLAPEPTPSPPPDPEPAPAPVYHSIVPPARQRAFEDLPWRYVGERSRDGARSRPTLKVLLVSHSACRTGAPLCLLRLAEELAKNPDVECWAVLRIGGEIRARFERVAPTLELYELESVLGFPWDDSPGEIAARFREFSVNGVAICNTMAVSDFHEALAAENIPVLSWVHELPTFIDLLGGEDAMERIRKGSRRTIVPADVVREALIEKFDFDPSRIQTIRYGLAARTRGLSREAMRKRVREEFELPADARIVLGCGTIDHRKGADLFAQLGRTFLLRTAPADLAGRTYFVWIGLTADEDLRRWLLHDVETTGLSDRVRFLSERQDMTPYLLAADLFALTSREDPCPFANLEAMESALAVVAFQDSGGAPEALGEGGVTVPYLDVAAMAEAARDLLLDDSKRMALGERGRALARSRFTWPRFMTEFQAILEADYGLRPATRPTVSVIVPSYRHAPYLEARLRSIFGQTVPPDEIIFLDDASPDESVEIARRLALESTIPMRVVVNERNSGGAFRQWMKGLELARGDLIWIAESDDCAHPEFLERLLPEFHDRDVVLAYCQSTLIDSEDRLLSPDFLGHTDDISPARWRSRYSATCDEEAEIALSRKNTIPNASAALFRRCDALDFADELAELRFAGDWLFYAMRIRGGKIAFRPEALNYYRRHEMSVSHESFKADAHAEETLYVKIRVIETYSVSANAIRLGLAQTFLEHAMLARMFNLKRPPLTTSPRPAIARLLDRARRALERQTEACGELRILFILDAPRRDLALISSLRLINDLARDHRVHLCVALPSAESGALAADLDERVIPIEGTLGATPWSSDGFEGEFRVDVLKELIRFHNIDEIHSRFEEADRLAATINADLNLPWIAHSDDARSALNGSARPALEARPRLGIVSRESA